MRTFIKAESWGDPVSKEPGCSSRLQLSKKRRRCLDRPGGFSWWSQDRNAGPAKTWNTTAWATHTFQFSSFALTLLSHPHASTLVHDHFDYSCMPSKSIFTPLHSFSPCPSASHTGLTRSLSLPVCFWSRFASAFRLRCVHAAVV